MRRRPRHRLDEDEPLDEATQQDIIESLELEAAQKHTQYRRLFTAVLLLPTPAFLLAPHARRAPGLALEALVSIAASVYVLWYSQPTVARLNAALAAAIVIQVAAARRTAWTAADALWLLPLTSIATVLALERSNSAVLHELAGLHTKKFKLS